MTPCSVTTASFDNVQGDETWLEHVAGCEAEGCGAPAAPHDGSANATFVYDGDAQTLTLNGAGAIHRPSEGD